MHALQISFLRAYLTAGPTPQALVASSDFGGQKRCLADIDAFPSHSASYDRIGVCCSVSFPNEKGNSKVTNWKCQ